MTVGTLTAILYIGT